MSYICHAFNFAVVRHCKYREFAKLKVCNICSFRQHAPEAWSIDLPAVSSKLADHLFPSIHFDIRPLSRKHYSGTARRLKRARRSAKATCLVNGKRSNGMTNGIIIGVDLVKAAFQLHGPTVDGKLLFRKKLSRGQFLRFMSDYPEAVAPMEVCGCPAPIRQRDRRGLSGAFWLAAAYQCRNRLAPRGSGGPGHPGSCGRRGRRSWIG
jgi:hypothetical protein